MIRRQKLIWFALGTLTSMLFSLAMVLLPTRLILDEASTYYVILEEPISGNQQNDSEGAGSVADRTGRLMRECGAKFFQTTFLSGESLPTAELPIIPDNINALPCIISQADREGIKITTEARWGDPEEIALEIRGSDR